MAARREFGRNSLASSTSTGRCVQCSMAFCSGLLSQFLCESWARRGQLNQLILKYKKILLYLNRKLNQKLMLILIMKKYKK